jgi:kynurenine formamidase
MGTGVAWSIDVPLEGLIEPETLERMHPRVEPGDIVLLETGIAKHLGTPDYDRHASLSVEAAQWFVDQGVKLLAMDVLTPELSIGRRPPEGFDYPVHRTLLRDGVLIAESVANARSLAGRRAEFLFLPLNIVGGDGAPARVLGRPVLD